MLTANANSKCAGQKAQVKGKGAVWVAAKQAAKQADGFCQYCFEYDKKTQVSLGLAGL